MRLGLADISLLDILGKYTLLVVSGGAYDKATGELRNSVASTPIQIKSADGFGTYETIKVLIQNLETATKSFTITLSDASVGTGNNIATVTFTLAGQSEREINLPFIEGLEKLTVNANGLFAIRRAHMQVIQDDVIDLDAVTDTNGMVVSVTAPGVNTGWAGDNHSFTVPAGQASLASYTTPNTLEDFRLNLVSPAGLVLALAGVSYAVRGTVSFNLAGPSVITLSADNTLGGSSATVQTTFLQYNLAPATNAWGTNILRI